MSRHLRDSEVVDDTTKSKLFSRSHERQGITKTLWLCYIDDVPTVYRFDGLRVVIYPSDHPPAHVHVIGAGREAIFSLQCPHGPPELRDSFGFAFREANRIRATLTRALPVLCEEWRRIHGHY